MAGPLNTILSAVVARFPADWQKTDTLGTPLIGDASMAMHGTPPRAAWVLVSETLEGPDGRRGVPGALWVRRAQLDLFLWAADLDGAETMVDAAVRALHAECAGALRFSRNARWAMGTDAIQQGVGYALPVELWIPITRTADTSATVTQLPTTIQIQKADGTAETSHVQQVP